MQYYFTVNGRKRPVHNPLGKALIIVWVSFFMVILLALCIISLPFHCLLWLLGFRGFFNYKTSQYQPFNLVNAFKRQ